MKRTLKVISFLYFAACGWYLFTGYAQAYIDPSTVTYIVQAVAGIFIALGAVVVIMRHKIAAFFRKLTNKKGKKNQGQQDTADKYGNH